MEHSPLERKLPVKKHHQKLVEWGEDSGFEVNLFPRHSAPVCSPVVASAFGIIAAVWWFLCVCVFLYSLPSAVLLCFRTAQTQDLFHLSTFVSPNNGNNHCNSRSWYWAVPRLVFTTNNGIKLPANPNPAVPEDVVGSMIVFSSFSFICLCPGTCLCDVFL